MPVDLLIVADDLTGALDAGAPFAALGHRVCVARRGSGLVAAAATGARILAVATGTRDGDATAAGQGVEALAAPIRALGTPALFKKIDSRLKGHVAVEVEAVAKIAGAARVLTSPAIPELGRVVRAGRVEGAGVATPIEIAPTFGAARPVEVANADSDADLDATVARAGPNDLLVGARGLAAAMARRMGGAEAPAEPWPAGSVLLAIGSRDPLTLAQIDALDTLMPVILAPDGVFSPDALRRALAHGVALVRMTGEGSDPRAGARFAAGVAEVLARDGPAVLVACGGETADAILAIAGIEILELRGEPFPGVPRARAATPAGPLEVVTKSGGFGDRDLLRRLVDQIRPGPGAGGRPRSTLEGRDIP